jgi:ribulose 1,5-bisphosphate synthetase/thiazole synthase
MTVDPESIQTDVTVVGGGMAGLVAAIAAARQGLMVALVRARSVLGGNGSSEVRVSVAGAACGKFNRYARESGIIEELLLKNRYHNTDGNAPLWDALSLDYVLAEAPRLRLSLNTTVTDVKMAAATMTVMPMVVLFVSAQRYFVRGVALSGIKG